MNNCTIIVPTHTNYLDICKINDILINIFWKTDYKIVYSLYGERVELKGNNVVFNETDNILDCITNAAKLFPSDCYMVLLGDAFILDRVDSQLIDSAINSFVSLGLQYCNLIPYKTIHKKRVVNDYFYYINRRDRYSHSFVAFLASPDFINNEFANSYLDSDRDFELKYLEETKGINCNSYYRDHVCLRDNILHIVPGIEKGQWNRIVRNRIEKTVPDVIENNRMSISLQWQIVLILRKQIMPIIPDSIRLLLKRLISKCSFSNFNTEL